MANIRNRGVTLIDSMVAVSIFVILFVGFFTLVQLGVKMVTEHKARVGALSIASSKIEYIRSLEYSAVGTQSGDPLGVLETLSYDFVNGITYTINTDIQWVDDPLDGTYGNGDMNPHDYKSVRVQVSWEEGGITARPVVLSSYVADFIIE